MAGNEDQNPSTQRWQIPKDEFCVYDTVYAHPERADALEAVYAETTRLAQFEPGIIYYCLCRDGENRNAFHFFERCTGKKAFDDHNSQLIIQKLLSEDMYIDRVEARFLKPRRPAKQSPGDSTK